MRLDYRRSSLVILGGWNPHIMNEIWIRKNLLNNSNEQLKFNVDANRIPSIGVNISLTEAIFNNVKLTIAGDRLEIRLANSKDFTHITNCVQKLCESQASTVITGYGVNFNYRDNQISDELRSIFGQSNIMLPMLTENHACQINLDRIITNINVDINNQSKQSALRFNFHFNINDMSRLILNLLEYSMDFLKEKAAKFILNECGLRLED